MYSIILKDGKTINIKADDMVLGEMKVARFYYGLKKVAEINMDNVAGWVRTNCIKNEE